MINFVLLVAACLYLQVSAVKAEESIIAMCYGPGLYGQKTASGVKLSKETFGVAHRQWPMGSNLNIKCNGKTVNTRIIDRGPFCKGPALDLTEATVRSLGFNNCAHFGVRKVKIER
jgi:rare lipoprotein A